jgi:hypothetical protein
MCLPRAQSIPRIRAACWSCSSPGSERRDEKETQVKQIWVTGIVIYDQPLWPYYRVLKVKPGFITLAQSYSERCGGSSA